MTPISTACFSGGWSVHPYLKASTTTTTAAGPEVESESWGASDSIGRYCGSIYATALIQSLSDIHPHLLNDARLDTKPQQEACSQKYPINSRRKHTTNLLVQFIKPFSTELIGSEINTKLISRLRMMIGSLHGQGGLEFLREFL